MPPPLLNSHAGSVVALLVPPAALTVAPLNELIDSGVSTGEDADPLAVII